MHGLRKIPLEDNYKQTLPAGSASKQADSMLFFSMGMFILDDIVYPSGRKETNRIGGAGTFATVGAGIVTSTQDRKRVGFIVDKGSDFPDECEDQLRQYSLGIRWRSTPERKTTRALNVYGTNDERHFEYLSPKLQVTVDDLPSTKVLHLICSPQRCVEFVSNHANDSILIWEPVETACKSEEWDSVRKIWNKVQVFSPNLLEAGLFVGLDTEADDPEQLLREHYDGFHGWLILRCGARGSLLRSPNRTFKWYPAYHRNPKAVKDPSGGGNSFLGGLGAGLAEDPTDWDLAMAKGSVAASFIIEQIGLPTYDLNYDTWNGCNVSQRLNQYLEMLNARD